MKPGNELNAIVAEKIFGWEIYQDQDQRDRSYVKHNAGGGYLLPDFSCDMGAAYQVVQEMIKRDYVNRFTMVETQSWHKCYFGKDNDEFAEKGESVPHAICMAALKAEGWSEK